MTRAERLRQSIDKLNQCATNQCTKCRYNGVNNCWRMMLGSAVKQLEEELKRTEKKNELQREIRKRPETIQYKKEHAARYYQEHKEEISAYRKAYNRANKEKVTERNHKYWEANKERLQKMNHDRYLKKKAEKAAKAAETEGQNEQGV